MLVALARIFENKNFVFRDCNKNVFLYSGTSISQFFKNDLSCWSVILLFQVSRLSASKEFLLTRIRLMKGQLSTLTTRLNER